MLLGTTLRDFVRQLQPYRWETDDWDLERWFEWPPDVFALTSLILSSTGAYRRAIAAPEGDLWPQANWSSYAKNIATEWRNSLCTQGVELPEQLKDFIKVLQQNQNVLIDRLYDSNFDKGDNSKGPDPNGNPWQVCKTLLELHAIADETMRGVGVIFSPRSSLLQFFEQQSTAYAQPSTDSTRNVADNVAFFYLQANYLLTLRGSLSRIPKYRGVVLPKSRTPQVGLSLRSLSNHLTFHQTEVDIAWRAFPWFNFDENTLNVMVVPWPYNIPAMSFSSITHPMTQQSLGTSRYFHYKPKGDFKAEANRIVRLIVNSKNEVRRVHLLVFPEMALRDEELELLKRCLRDALKPHEMPMIISGVSQEYLNQEEEQNILETSPKLDHYIPSPSAKGYNRVVLSVFYAEKWHDVIQEKHHRWLLSQSQIEQYNLGGALSGSRPWWEAIHIPRRRLSILAANSWLTICPLICEDLARQEPVSDLIRGIGPTLLTALLLDGPQIKERWSARYASVLADDPGSSVLTLTALGMSRRSRITHAASSEVRSTAREQEDTIALWKDQEKGWKEIRAADNDTSKPKILIVSALWKSESTIDGRTESDNSAVFTYQGDYSPIDKSIGNDSQMTSSHDDHSKFPKTKEKDAEYKERKVLDMCELTLFTYYVDALIDSKVNPSFLNDWFYSVVRAEDPETQEIESDQQFNRLTQELISLNRESIRDRDSVPKHIPTPHLIFAIGQVTKLVAEVKKEKAPTDNEIAVEIPLEYWKRLVDRSEKTLQDILSKFNELIRDDNSEISKELEADEANVLEKHRALHGPGASYLINKTEIGRIWLSAPMSVLWAVHVRLATRRRYGTLHPEDAQVLERVERILESNEEYTSEHYHEVYRNWKKKTRNGRAKKA